MENLRIFDVVQDTDGDIAIIENEEKDMYLLRFITPVVQGVAYWYKKENFEKIEDIDIKKEALKEYNYLRKNNKFRAF